MAFDTIQTARGTEADILAHTNTKEGELFVSLDTEKLFAAKADGGNPVLIAGVDGLVQVGTAWIGGDKTGNTRGADSLDIQTSRAITTQVASGDSSRAIGRNNTASGFYSSAFGNENTSSGDYSTTLGHINTATAFASTSFGYTNSASGDASCAIGTSNTAIGVNSSSVGYNNQSDANNSSAFGNGNRAEAVGSSAFGNSVKTTVTNSTEVGYWSNNTTREGAVRVQGTGTVSMTVENQATAFTDGGATAGSEADGTLGRNMFALRRNGDTFILDFNDAGTIKSLTLGTAT